MHTKSHAFYDVEELLKNTEKYTEIYINCEKIAVDHEMFYLVEYFNQKGLSTLACCQGVDILDNYLAHEKHGANAYILFSKNILEHDLFKKFITQYSDVMEVQMIEELNFYVLASKSANSEPNFLIEQTRLNREFKKRLASFAFKDGLNINLCQSTLLDNKNIFLTDLTDIQTWLNDMEIENYTIHSDLTVDVEGDVKLSYKNLAFIPIQFGRVQGSFNVEGNQLTTLKGAPLEINGNFNCAGNELTNLAYLPQGIKDLRANQNSITHLEDLKHVKIRRQIDVSYNNITSLKGMPEELKHSFNCARNLLINLEGGPIDAPDSYDCSYNALTSLKGAPKRVSGEFNIEHNNLTTLEYIPALIGENLIANHNKIIHLEHLSEAKLEGDVKLSFNYIKSLKGSPQKVHRHFDISNNHLTTLLGGPIFVGRDYNCANNELVNLEGVAQKTGFINAFNNKITSIKGLAYCKMLDVSSNQLDSFEEFKEIFTLSLVNVRKNLIKDKKQLLALEHIDNILISDLLNENQDLSIYSVEDKKTYFDFLNAQIEKEQFEQNIIYPIKKHQKTKI